MKTYAVDVYITVAKTYEVGADSADSAWLIAEGKVNDLLKRCDGTIVPLHVEGFEVCEDDTSVNVLGYRDGNGQMTFG